MLRTFFLTLLFVTPLCTVAAPIQLTPYSATYSATFKGMSLEAVRTLTPLGNHRYQIASNGSHLVGRIEESSEFTLEDNNRIRPHHYKMSRKIFGVSKSESTQFDWQKNVAFYQSKKKNREVNLQGDDLDWLGYQVQLGIDLKAGKSDVEYRIVRRGRSKLYRFVVENKEAITTPMGEIQTVKLQQIRTDKKRQTTIWVAPEYNYLLVKLHQVEENGDQFELFLKQIDQHNATAAK